MPCVPGEGIPRKIVWGCAARFPKPFPYLTPISAIFLPYSGFDLTKTSTPCLDCSAGTVALNIIYEELLIITLILADMRIISSLG